MEHKNYRQYINQRETVKPVDESMPIEEAIEEVIENPTEETVETLEEVIEETVDKSVEETIEEYANEQFGKVTGCLKLNIRKEPNTDAYIECVINEGSELKIDKSKSIEGWFRVCAANGVEGYCMSKFVEIK